jgi:heavy metal sensor kinase
MKLLRTIRTRFALWATLLILLLLIAFGAFVYFNLSRSLSVAIDQALSLSADQAAAGLDIQNGIIMVPEASQDEIGGEALAPRGLTLIVLSADETITQAIGPYRNSPVPASDISGKGAFLTSSINQDLVRAYILPLEDNGQQVGWVETLQSLQTTNESLASLQVTLLLGIGLSALLAGVAGYFLAAQALRPIDEITQAARSISVNDLGARLNLPNTGDEVSRLANTFNEMLGRLESGFERERQFTADASHELRTPVAAMEAILSVVREGKRPTQEYRQAFEDLAEENNRLKELIDDLLSLARGEGGIKLHIESFDLSLLLIDLADAMRPLAAAKALTIKHEVPAQMMIKADRDLLIRLFVNLLENAIKYTQHGAIEISTSTERATAVIKISDSGPGIAAQHLPHIFERFYRADAARNSKGTGLGLAIASQIAIAHGGSLEADSVVGRGSTFTVRLKR